MSLDASVEWLLSESDCASSRMSVTLIGSSGVVSRGLSILTVELGARVQPCCRSDNGTSSKRLKNHRAWVRGVCTLFDGVKFGDAF